MFALFVPTLSDDFIFVLMPCVAREDLDVFSVMEDSAMSSKGTPQVCTAEIACLCSVVTVVDTWERRGQDDTAKKA